MTDEKKVLQNYRRSPYQHRLLSIGFQRVICVSLGKPIFTPQAFQTLALMEYAVLMSRYEVLKQMAMESNTLHTLYCYIAKNDMQGVLIREPRDTGWYRRGYRSPHLDDMSLGFVNVTDEVGRELYLPKPRHTST